MKIQDAIINMPLTGFCDIDIDKTVQAFNSNSFISKWKDEYQLVQMASGEQDMKITIKEEDAKQLIILLNLSEEKSNVFNNASTFKL